MRAILIGCALAFGVLAHAYAAETAESVAAAFCSVRAAPDQAVYDPLLTASLKQLIAEAWKKNEEFKEANPGDKPPLGDGIQFQSYPDQSPVCRAGAVTPGMASTTVDIEHLFPDTRDADWTDRLVLLPDGDRLLIDDVLYGPEQFKLGLRAVLQSIVDGKF
jgi:hypothetical protein